LPYTKGEEIIGKSQGVSRRGEKNEKEIHNRTKGKRDSLMIFSLHIHDNGWAEILKKMPKKNGQHPMVKAFLWDKKAQVRGVVKPWLKTPVYFGLNLPCSPIYKYFYFHIFHRRLSPKDLREQKLSAAQKDKLNKHDWALTTKTTTK